VPKIISAPVKMISIGNSFSKKIVECSSEDLKWNRFAYTANKTLRRICGVSPVPHAYTEEIVVVLKRIKKDCFIFIF